MNRHTGRALDEKSHIAQSINDILTTRLGTRVMRRDYGSQLPDLIDQPANAATRILCYAAVAIALMRWEPRIQLSRVEISDITQQGQLEISLEGAYTNSGAAMNQRITLSMGALA